MHLPRESDFGYRYGAVAATRHGAMPGRDASFCPGRQTGGYMSKTVLALALACAGCALIAPDVMAQGGGQATHGGIVIRLEQVSDSLGPF